jgi:HTH-type transcriptional regulator/antitoxin HigA
MAEFNASAKDRSTMNLRNPYEPSYVEPPGATVQEYLDTLQISARELARRCGRSPKLISEIISGKAALEPETILQLARVLELDASVWMNMEAQYRLYLARLEEDKELAVHIRWAQSFPLKELGSRGYVSQTSDAATQVRQLLKFFGAGTVEACRRQFTDTLTVAYRHSPSFESNKECLLSWLRIGEIKADRIRCADFDRGAFVETLREIRLLTTSRIEEFLPKIQERCATAGVAFVVERPFEQVALSGISRWLSGKKALIQQTLRHLSNDHFWFTFFHECAHLLLHSRKVLFIDAKGRGSADPELEAEANDWAANFLVPQASMARFITRFSYKDSEVIRFAEEQGVAPGIIVGQLQHRKVIRFNQMNHLRQRYEWND